MNVTSILNHSIHCSCRVGNVQRKLCNWPQLQCLLMVQIHSHAFIKLFEFYRRHRMDYKISLRSLFHLSHSLHARHFNYMHCSTSLALIFDMRWKDGFLKRTEWIRLPTKVSIECGVSRCWVICKWMLFNITHFVVRSWSSWRWVISHRNFYAYRRGRYKMFIWFHFEIVSVFS